MKKLVAALMFLFATAVWAGDFEDGVTALKNGDYNTAASLFKKAAEQGGATSQHNLGLTQHFLKIWVQNFAEFGNDHPPTISNEQGAAQVIFQPFDRLG